MKAIIINHNNNFENFYTFIIHTRETHKFLETLINNSQATNFETIIRKTLENTCKENCN